MTCLENIIVISTMFIVLVTIQATKAEGKFIKLSHYFIFFFFWKRMLVVSTKKCEYLKECVEHCKMK